MRKKITIVDYLQNENYDLRVINDDKWLVYDTDDKKFVVYQHKKYAKSTTQLIRTDDEEQAVNKLTDL